MSLFTPNTVTLMITFNMFRFWQFEHVECLSFVVFFIHELVMGGVHVGV